MSTQFICDRCGKPFRVDNPLQDMPVYELNVKGSDGSLFIRSQHFHAKCLRNYTNDGFVTDEE